MKLSETPDAVQVLLPPLAVAARQWPAHGFQWQEAKQRMALRETYGGF